jgi:hypothetical protein
MTDHETNGKSVQDLEQENARLRRELSEAKYRRMLDRDAICMLLGNGKPISLEDVQGRIAAGSPFQEQLIELEKVMKEQEQVLMDMMANPVPFQVVLDDLERLRGEGHAQ